MKLRNFTKKKAVAFGLAFGVAAGAGGIAAAYFTSSGTGTGTADVGGVKTALTINQVGAGFNSLVTSNGYLFSQCFTACSGPSHIGGQVTLAHTSTGYGQLTSATVALVNFTAAKTLTVILTIYGSPNTTSYTFTRKTVNIAKGTATTQVVTPVTFTFAKKEVFADTTFHYSVQLVGTTTGVNIALATAPKEVTVGSTTGETWTGSGSATFAANAGYAGYVPAARFNIIGGVVPPMYPGSSPQPVQYAITNPNPGLVRVDKITAVKEKKAGTTTVFGTTGCRAYWFTLANPTFTYNMNVAPGTTIVTGSPTTIQLTTTTTNQDACETASVPLTFTSN